MNYDLSSQLHSGFKVARLSMHGAIIPAMLASMLLLLSAWTMLAMAGVMHGEEYSQEVEIVSHEEENDADNMTGDDILDDNDVDKLNEKFNDVMNTMNKFIQSYKETIRQQKKRRKH